MPGNITDHFRYSDKSASKKEYFSGANVQVYFGDVWVEELNSIQFQMEETLVPIYGFNSYLFDKMARGTRMVQGSFSLNFTESGYLQTILNRVGWKIDKENRNLLTTGNTQNLKVDVQMDNSQRNIENLLAMNDANETYDGYIEGLQDSFWGTQPTSSNAIASSGTSKEYDTFFFPDPEGTGDVNPLKDHGFNILIDFSPEANQRDFQDIIRNGAKDGSLYQTFRSIIGVHILNESQTVAPNGEVLTQNYSFIARDLDGDVTQLSMKYNHLYDNSTNG